MKTNVFFHFLLFFCCTHNSLQAQIIDAIPQYFYACEGDTTLLIPEIDPNVMGTDFEWTSPDGFPTNQMVLPFQIDSATLLDEGNYILDITDPNGTSLYINEQIIFQLYDLDSLGGKIFPDQLIIQYEDDVTQGFKDSLRMEFAATLIDSCVCGTLELWQLIPDQPIVVPPANTLINLNEKKNELAMRVGTKAVEYNRPTQNNAATNDNLTAFRSEQPTKRMMEQPPILDFACDKVRVAIIDNGIDYTHINLRGDFWVNPLEEPGIADNDENCLPADLIGWDFDENEADPIDQVDGHGTHVAGIVDTTFSKFNTADVDLEIVPIRALNEDGEGDLFDLICSVLYAKNEKADIINMSLGWQGDSSVILYNAIDNQGELCAPLFVASAGNEFTNNDEIRHFPSGYQLDNIIEVAAFDGFDGEGGVLDTMLGAHYSNYGASVDVATLGSWESTYPNDDYEFLEGTSMAAGYVSGVAAVLLAAEPGMDWLDLKGVLLSEAAKPANISLMGNTSIPDFVNNNTVLDTLSSNIMSGINATAMIDGLCPCSLTDIERSPVPVRETNRILPYPNPSRDLVFLDFNLVKSGVTQLWIFDQLGRIVEKQTHFLTAGEQQLVWKRKESLPNSVYYFKVFNSQQSFIGKVLIVSK